MLRQAENRVRIEGILSEINLKYGSYQKNGRTVDNIGGDIKVLVKQEINGEQKDFIIPVYMFAAKYTNAGKPNPAYASIETVMKEYVSIAASGSEAAADKIRKKFKGLAISKETKELVSDFSLSSEEMNDERTKYILGY